MILALRKQTLKYITSIMIMATLIGTIILHRSNDKTVITVMDPFTEYYGADTTEKKVKIIRWVDFNIPYEALKKALSLDLATYEHDIHLNWIELLAYLAARNGNNFSGYRDRQLDVLAEKIRTGISMEELTKDMKYYSYYLKAFQTILSNYVGEYEIQIRRNDGTIGWESKYGVKVFSPIAKHYSYQHYDDFGNTRSYGFQRTHLGNDLLGSTGTPIIAVEGGVVEAIGWNRFGGWRLGIRSHDGKRYYYYAHLRKNFPYHKSLDAGSIVKAGDVIGYMGRTGYSWKENENNIDTTHLHFGINLMFDESQKNSKNEIWIDVYHIVRLLDQYRSEVQKDPETKDYHRVYQIQDLIDQVTS